MDKAEAINQAYLGFSEAFGIVLYSIVLKYAQITWQNNTLLVQVFC